jgi:hypothetical protein
MGVKLDLSAWKNRLMVSERRVLKGIFVPKKEEVTEYGGYRVMRWKGHVARMGMRNVYKILIEKSERKG